MPDRSVYLLEAGLCAQLPGIARRTPGATFPFWGNLMLFDFAYAALRGLSDDPCWVVSDSRDRQAATQAAGRWGKGAHRQRDGERGLAELRRTVAADRSAMCVVSAMSYAAFPDPGALASAVDARGARRLRVDSVALPVYVMERAYLQEALEKACAEVDPERATLSGFVADYLPGAVREYADVPGKVFFFDGIPQLWESQHFLRESLGGTRAARYIGTLDGPPAPAAEARVTQTGRVKDSLIASGAVIEGSVTDSVIFPGVVVRAGARVRQCVVMSGNRIGADARVSNTLVLPWQQETGGETDNVGQGAEIGETRNVAQTRNDDHPRHITRGLTLLSMNATVPPGVVVGAGCYVGPAKAAELRAMKRLDRGASLP